VTVEGPSNEGEPNNHSDNAIPEDKQKFQLAADLNNNNNNSIKNTKHRENKEKLNDRDYILNILHLLPEQWIGKEMKLHVIADRKDADWITKRVFQCRERSNNSAIYS